jgi:hypothetical protein
MDLLPLAHVGHWLEGALYLAPGRILIVVLLVQGRWGGDEAADGQDAAASPAP